MTIRTRAGPPDRTEMLQIFLAAAAIAAAAAAALVSLTSNHAPGPVGHAAISVVLCITFVGGGLLALETPPFGRFGLLLAAVGFSSLLGALHDANGALAYTIGVLSANLVFAVLVETVLAYPKGVLGSRRNRLLVLAAYLNVVVLQAVAVLFDPLTRWNSAHPENLALVSSHETLSTVLEEAEGVIAILIALAVAAVLLGRVRSATPPSRRHLTPVLYGGSGGLLCFAVGLVLAPISSSAAVVGIGLGLLASLALPLAFIVMLIRGRMSSAAVGELLAELHEGAEAPDLQDSLRRTLGDPGLEVGYLREEGRYVDAHGRELVMPEPRGTRVATPILHHQETVGVIVHDRALALRWGLLEAVGAAAGFALANERALEAVRRMENRNRVLMDAIPDMILRLGRDGTYLDAHSENESEMFLPAAEIIGHNICDFLPSEVTDAAFECMDRALESGKLASFDYEFVADGVHHSREARIVPSGPGEVVTIVRDFTEQRRAQAELSRLADEQAALRRVATIAAGDAAPEEVFQAVTEEICGLLRLGAALLLRFEDASTATVVGRFGEPTADVSVGDAVPMTDGAAAAVRQTGAPVRVAYADLEGEIARRMLALGFRASIAVPIQVAGSTWGALVAALREAQDVPDHTDRRLEAFAELVALAVASAQARDDLAASRRRIIEAGDAERRRIERNLHDGAQQRLVALSVGLRLVQSKIRESPEEAGELVSNVVSELSQALRELRELAQGIHPAVLTERGLATALDVLAARTPLPVELDVAVDDPLPPPVEAAAYYVVSEALANVVKHARAEAARVRVVRANGHALVDVSDDGEGGADPDHGSGLCGLRDRVETLNGRLVVESPSGRGTRIRAELPVP
jgi:signal transduction histidine kinase/PAS domain-containing protein